MELNFRSDNESPAAPAIMAALQEANRGSAWAYAEDRWSERLDTVFSDLFETRVTVLPVSTGTVANSIALAAVTPPWGSVYCHRNAHILNDESGAPEFFGNGLRLVPIEGPQGRFDADLLLRTIRATEGHGVHSYAPAAVSLTQSTESGTVYPPEQIEAICAAAAGRGLATHLDGARFGNAIAALGCTPAVSSCRAGIQMLSFGAAKNGCMGAEALVLFHDNCERGGLDVAQLKDRAERLRKRSGHLLSKMRYVSAQLLAYVADGLWLQLAAHANAQAHRFAEAVERHPEAALEYPVEANEVFVRWSAEGFSQLEQAGMQFLYWPGRDDLARFVFAHCTDPKETDALIAAL